MITSSLCPFCLLPSGHTGPHQVQRPARMDGAELRCRREYLGLSSDDLAGLLGVNPRTVRSWELGRDPLPDRVRDELSALEDEFEDEVNKAVATYAGTANRVIFVAPGSGADDEGYPHRWGRHVAARVRRLVPGIVIRTAGEG